MLSYSSKLADKYTMALGAENKRSVVFYMIIMTGFIVCTILLATFLGVGYRIYQQDISEINYYAKSNADRLSKSLAAPLWTFDEVTVKGILEASLKDPAVAAMRIVNPKGDVITEIASPLHCDDFKSCLEQNKFSSVLARIESEDKENLGTLEVLNSYAAAEKALRSLVWTMVFALIVGVTVLVTLLGILLSRIISVSFNEIKKGTEQIKQGYFEYQLPSMEYREFQEVADSFNSMCLAIINRDTELKHHTENLEIIVAERTRELEEKSTAFLSQSRLAALGEMSAGIAHEINNPLNILLGKSAQIGMLLQKDPIDKVKIGDHAGKIVLMAKRIAKIIQSLRSFSRDGKNDPFDRVCAQEIIEHVTELLDSRLKNHGINLRLHTPPEPVMIVAREVEIGQVIGNLVTNALDAIDAFPEKWIEIRIAEVENGMVRFTVTDSGNGIPKEVRDRMMQPFFTTKAVGKGTGLGLSIAKGIIEKHLGKFYYDEECQNTRFVIEIPKYTEENLQKMAA